MENKLSWAYVLQMDMCGSAKMWLHTHLDEPDEYLQEEDLIKRW